MPTIDSALRLHDMIGDDVAGLVRLHQSRAEMRRRGGDTGEDSRNIYKVLGILGNKVAGHLMLDSRQTADIRNQICNMAFFELGIEQSSENQNVKVFVDQIIAKIFDQAFDVLRKIPVESETRVTVNRG